MNRGEPRNSGPGLGAAAAVGVVGLYLTFWKVWLSVNLSRGSFPGRFLSYLDLSRECLWLRVFQSWRMAVSLYLSCDVSVFFQWQACLRMTEYEKARDFLVRAQHVQPFNHDINNELKKLAR